MKKFALAGVAAAALIAVPAIAQQLTAERGSVTRAQTEAMVEAAFAKVDTDRDGAISKEEAAGARSAIFNEKRMERRADRKERRANRAGNADARFARMDTDGDGSISRAEFDAQIAQRAERRAERGDRRGSRGLAMRGARFERADTDGNGTVTLTEATAQALQRFDRVDADRDGALTREERREARKARRAARG